MKVNIVARHIRLTKALKTHVEERMEKLQHFVDNIIWAQVILSVEKKTHKAEVIVQAGRQTFQSSSSSEDMYGAIDGAGDKIETQIRKQRDKMKDHRKTDSLSLKVVQESLMQPEVKFSVIKQVPVKPMNPEDAAFEMERLGYTFWMFLDEDTSQINLIFKRQDNSYGLIQPIKKI